MRIPSSSSFMLASLALSASSPVIGAPTGSPNPGADGGGMSSSDSGQHLPVSNSGQHLPDNRRSSFSDQKPSMNAFKRTSGMRAEPRQLLGNSGGSITSGIGAAIGALHLLGREEGHDVDTVDTEKHHHRHSKHRPHYSTVPHAANPKATPKATPPPPAAEQDPVEEETDAPESGEEEALERKREEPSSSAASFSKTSSASPSGSETGSTIPTATASIVAREEPSSLVESSSSIPASEPSASATAEPSAAITAAPIVARQEEAPEAESSSSVDAPASSSSADVPAPSVATPPIARSHPRDLGLGTVFTPIKAMVKPVIEPLGLNPVLEPVWKLLQRQEGSGVVAPPSTVSQAPVEPGTFEAASFGDGYYNGGNGMLSPPMPVQPPNTPSFAPNGILSGGVPVYIPGLIQGGGGGGAGGLPSSVGGIPVGSLVPGNGLGGMTGGLNGITNGLPFAGAANGLPNAGGAMNGVMGSLPSFQGAPAYQAFQAAGEASGAAEGSMCSSAPSASQTVV